MNTLPSNTSSHLVLFKAHCQQLVRCHNGPCLSKAIPTKSIYPDSLAQFRDQQKVEKRPKLFSIPQKVSPVTCVCVLPWETRKSLVTDLGASILAKKVLWNWTSANTEMR